MVANTLAPLSSRGGDAEGPRTAHHSHEILRDHSTTVSPHLRVGMTNWMRHVTQSLRTVQQTRDCRTHDHVGILFCPEGPGWLRFQNLGGEPATAASCNTIRLAGGSDFPRRAFLAGRHDMANPRRGVRGHKALANKSAGSPGKILGSEISENVLAQNR